MSQLRLAFALLALTVFSGCRCGPPDTGKLAPDFEADPKALSFEACPSKDEAGNPVQDVFPDEKTITLKNLGKAGGTVDVSFTGPDKDAFSVVQEKVPDSIGATLQETFPVRFAPLRRGDAQAQLVIDDGNDATPPLTVPLVGTGRNLPPLPTLKVSYEDKDQPNTFSECFAGGSCTVLFADTFYKESSSLRITLENTGCPALKVTGLEVLRLDSAPAGNLAFTVEEPGVPPSATTPILLTTADNNALTTLRLRFSPEDDGSGDTQRYALLKIKTNDPANAEFDITLFGSAMAPSVYVSPSFCNFTESSDRCGNAVKVPNKANFEIHNGGNAPISIREATFEKGGLAGRFQITQNVVDQQIEPGQFKMLEITYSDQPLFVTDRLTLTAVSGGQPAGQAIITLSGGVLPDLVTNPSDQLSFENPTDELTVKTLSIQNGPSGGELIINRVFVDTNPFFSVVEPKVAAGTKVPAGGSVQVSVQYKKPVSGGTQTGVLRIDTNDPDYGPPPYKVVRLYSVSPLDQLPVAVLKGCLPSDLPQCDHGRELAMNVNLSGLNPRELTVNGAASYDPSNTSPTPISNYQFRLVRKPGNATKALLQNDGLKTPASTAKLTLDPLATGEYLVTLLVYDDKNQQSARAAELRIYVSQ